MYSRYMLQFIAYSQEEMFYYVSIFKLFLMLKNFYLAVFNSKGDFAVF